MTEPAAAAPAVTTEQAAEPAAVKRASQRAVSARQDPEAELRREWREAQKARKLKLVAAQPTTEQAQDQPADGEAGAQGEQQAQGDQQADEPEAKTPWAQKVKAELADAQTKVQHFEKREAAWEDANRTIKHAHEDLADEVAHVRSYAAQLEALLKSIGKEVDPISKAHFDGQREIAKLKRQIERGQGITREQQSAKQQETLQASATSAIGALAAKFAELKNVKAGTPAGDYIELELSRWVRTGNFDGLEGRAAAWVATQRGAKQAQPAQPARPAQRPSSTTLAGQGGGASGKPPPIKGGQKFITDKDVMAELRAARVARGG